MKQIKIFKGYVDYGNELDKLEKAVNDWITSNNIVVIDIKQTACTGTGRYDIIVITVVYDTDETLQKEKVKQTDSYDRHYFQDAANEYMSR